MSEWQDFINQFIDTLNKMQNDMQEIRDYMDELDNDTHAMIDIIDNMYKHLSKNRKE